MDNTLREALSLLDKADELLASGDDHGAHGYVCTAGNLLRSALSQPPAPEQARLGETDIYDFAGWLTTRKVVMPVGSTCDAAPMAEAVGEYIKTFPERFAATPTAEPAVEAVPSCDLGAEECGRRCGKPNICCDNYIAPIPMLSASPAAPEAAKPEQQAQAGEPEVVRCNPADYCSARHSELITLQSHREAMATESERVLRLVNRQAADIAKKDAALQAGVEALKRSSPLVTRYAAGSADVLQSVSAAITQAQEALK